VRVGRRGAAAGGGGAGRVAEWRAAGGAGRGGGGGAVRSGGAGRAGGAAAGALPWRCFGFPSGPNLLLGLRAIPAVRFARAMKRLRIASRKRCRGKQHETKIVMRVPEKFLHNASPC